MRILVTTIAFVITMSGLFLFENYKNRPGEENYAQIIQELNNQNQSKTPTLQPSPKAMAGIAKPTNKSSKPPIKTPIPSTVQPLTTAPSTTLPSVSPTPISNNQQIATTPTFTPTITSAPESTPLSTPTLIPQPTQQNDQITVVSLTSPVKQNSTARLNIKTLPNAQCSIKVTLPSGNQSTAKGLEMETADASGNITWSWKINWNTKPGTAIIDLGCSKDSQNFSKSLQMIITE